LRSDDGDRLVRGDVDGKDVGRVLEEDDALELHLVLNRSSFGGSVVLGPVLSRVGIFEEARLELGMKEVSDRQIDQAFVDQPGVDLIFEREEGIGSAALWEEKKERERAESGRCRASKEDGEDWKTDHLSGELEEKQTELWSAKAKFSGLVRKRGRTASSIVRLAHSSRVAATPWRVIRLSTAPASEVTK
jgi:hypothetical protein